ncbi:hypothetical protein F2Q69_00012585 [Brassica cretica]|uniref:Uncharacterized protein n=1 Tax=Brassica cretica TaxID=69181 RepID=A0A8S9QI86_BRACR|nr:hypothetical protein F2Q69_00012585 [Brassica cretica]
MRESTQNGTTRTSGALGRQVEKGSTSGGPASNVEDSRDVQTGKGSNMCGAVDHRTWDCPLNSVNEAVPISVVPPASLARSASSATEGSNRRNLDQFRKPLR